MLKLDLVDGHGQLWVKEIDPIFTLILLFGIPQGPHSLVDGGA